MPRCVAASAVLALLLTASVAPAAGPPGVVRKPDLTFATVDGETLKLDLVMPAGGGPHPVVVCLHGGAWKFGDRKQQAHPWSWMGTGTPERTYVEMLAARGFAAASVTYRLAPKHKFPAQLLDVKSAVRYLRANAAALNLDPDRVAVLGFSAGGHLASLVGLTAGRPEFDPGIYPDQSDRVSCVVNFFGPTDLGLYAETPGIAAAFLTPLLGAGPATEAAYGKASPIQYVSKDAPPFLTLHGTADLIVPVIHAERLHAKLIDAGAKSVFVRMRGEGHGWDDETATESTAAAVRFLAEHLAAKPGR